MEVWGGGAGYKFVKDIDISSSEHLKKINIKIIQQLKSVMYYIRIYNHCTISKPLLSYDGVSILNITQGKGAIHINK